MSLRVVLDFDFKSRLALHAKRGTIKLAFFIIFLVKCNFLRTTPNIGNIYIYIIEPREETS